MDIIGIQKHYPDAYVLINCPLEDRYLQTHANNEKEKEMARV